MLGPAGAALGASDGAGAAAAGAAGAGFVLGALAAFGVSAAARANAVLEASALPHKQISADESQLGFLDCMKATIPRTAAYGGEVRA